MSFNTPINKKCTHNYYLSCESKLSIVVDAIYEQASYILILVCFEISQLSFNFYKFSIKHGFFYLLFSKTQFWNLPSPGKVSNRFGTFSSSKLKSLLHFFIVSSRPTVHLFKSLKQNWVDVHKNANIHTYSFHSTSTFYVIPILFPCHYSYEHTFPPSACYSAEFNFLWIMLTSWPPAYLFLLTISGLSFLLDNNLSFSPTTERTNALPLECILTPTMLEPPVIMPPPRLWLCIATLRAILPYSSLSPFCFLKNEGYNFFLFILFLN